jgi:hypothetical protein
MNLSKIGMNKNDNVDETGSDHINETPTKMSNAGGFAGFSSGIDARGSGSLAFGKTGNHSYDDGQNPAYATSTIKAFGEGSFAGGSVPAESSYISTSAAACFAFGFAAGGDNGTRMEGAGPYVASAAIRCLPLPANKGGHQGSFALGHATGGSVSYSTAIIETSGSGTFAQGYTNYGQILNHADGAVVVGWAGNSVVSYGTGLARSISEALLRNRGRGSFVTGYVNQAMTGLGSYTGNISAAILNDGPGNMMFGCADTTDTVYTGSTDTDKNAIIHATDQTKGSFAGGYVTSKNGRRGEIGVRNKGGFAIGSAISSDIIAYGQGSFAGGSMLSYDESSSHDAPTHHAIKTTADAQGGFAFGFAHNGNIISSAKGAIAMGHAKNVGNITASQLGAFAIGCADASGGGSIAATGVNSVQFGYGSNSIASAVAVGNTFRLRGKTQGTTPSTLRNGDMWVKSNYVYIRSNGSNVKIS